MRLGYRCPLWPWIKFSSFAKAAWQPIGPILQTRKPVKTSLDNTTKHHLYVVSIYISRVSSCAFTPLSLAGIKCNLLKNNLKAKVDNCPVRKLLSSYMNDNRLSIVTFQDTVPLLILIKPKMMAPEQPRNVLMLCSNASLPSETFVICPV